MQKNNIFTAFKLFVTMLALGAGSLFAQGAVTVQLLASDNATGLDGGNVYYYDGGWQLLGATGNNGPGIVAGNVPKTTDIEIRYIGGQYKWVSVDPSTNPTLTINTVAVTVKLETCNGTPLVGEAQYYYSGWPVIGNTEASIELLPYSGLGPGQGNYDFRMKYDGRTSPILTQDISVDPVVVFTTTKVSLYGPDVRWYNGGWQPFASPKEVIGGTSNKYGNTAWADFKFDGSGSPTVRLDIDGCSLSGGILTLVGENGAPLANYPADYPGENRNLRYRYRCGGSWAPWTSFQTDANGQVFYNIDCSTVGSGTSNWDGKISMTLNQTTLEQDVSVNSTFQAARVNVNLETCDPTQPLSGGVVAQGGGYWYTHGTTDGTGTVSFYAFPGNNVKVRMDYNYKSVIQDAVAVNFPTTDVDFVTTTINFIYSGTIEIQAGGWPAITTPIELLPGTYGFRFDGDLVSVDVSECNCDAAQADSDQDGIGDACDPCPNDADNDIDGDGFCTDADNCPNTANPSQADTDNDGIGDVCDACPNDFNNDSDGDGVCGDIDGCPFDPNKTDPGACGCGVADTDTDSDGFEDCIDACPNDPDNDIDNDGVCGDFDGCPFDPNKTDPGACGCGVADTDMDSDGTADCIDACPNDPDNDIDNDGVCGDVDNCPNTANPDQADADNDGQGDACDQGGVCINTFVSDLTGYVDGLSISSSRKRAINARLELAETKFCNGYPVYAIVSTLEYVISYVNYQSGSGIPASQANYIIAQINMLIDALDDGTVSCCGHRAPNPGSPGQVAAAEVLQLQANPNPFHGEVSIRFNLPEAGPATLEVFNLNGKRVATLHSGYLDAGYQDFCWNGADDGWQQLSAGVYLVRLQTEEGMRIKKLSLMR